MKARAIHNRRRDASGECAATRRAVVLVSGGMDSAVVAAIARAQAEQLRSILDSVAIDTYDAERVAEQATVERV